MNEYERLVAGWHGAAHGYGHAAEALGLDPFPLADDTDGHQVATAFALRVAQVLAKTLVDMHIADVNMRGNQGPAEAIAQTVMKLLPGIGRSQRRAPHAGGRPAGDTAAGCPQQGHGMTDAEAENRKASS